MNKYVQKKLALLLLAFFFFANISLRSMELSNDKSTISRDETSLSSQHKLELKSLPNISDETLNELYKHNEYNFDFYIPQSELDSIQKPSDLKEVFEKYQLSIDVTAGGLSRDLNPWRESHWEKAYAVLKERTEGISIEELSRLLKDAKLILKSFLPEDYSIYNNPNYRKKTNSLNRIFTYTKLRRVIEAKQLSHIHLPVKYIGIQEIATGKYLNKEEASKILDDIIKISVSVSLNALPQDPDFSPLYAKIVDQWNNYSLFVFSETQAKTNKPLSAEAFRELKTLVSEAPFDIGYDNIFSDFKGDAIIIDTEFKQDYPETSLAKLYRYASQ